MLLLGLLFVLARQAVPVHHIWLEAESFGPLKGGNFSFQPVEQTTRGSWSIAGPDAAASWTQGGESEFMSIAARADEPDELVVGRDMEVPEAGRYRLWVRYADYREKTESFGIRIKQGGVAFQQAFGLAPIVDELDPVKLMWGWAYGWGSAEATLEKGAARIELYTTGITQARRNIDCLCLTTDPEYHPTGRRKPEFAAWGPLRAMQTESARIIELAAARQPLQTLAKISVLPIPPAWQIATGPPSFVWNVGEPWWNELKSGGFQYPFGLDPPIVKPFLDAFKSTLPPIFSHVLSGATWHIPFYPQAFANGSPFLAWLDRNPDRKFAILLNYGDPSWPANSDRAAVHDNLKKFKDRFVGFVAGESIAYDTVDQASLDTKIKAAKNRREILAALRDEHTKAVIKKFSDYYGAPVTAEEAWAPIIPCLSASMEAFAHALCNWGVKRIGHENTGNSPTLARRLAFLRGAARQMGVKIADYQSCNLGDSATMYSREHYFYPASSRYILDNSYDAFAGAGMAWLLRDYLLWHLAGVDTFYNEQGVDLFWKPGGGVAGDNFPVELSPKGRVAETALNIAANHPRGTQYTPIAFLVDEAHGWAQERFQNAAFGLDPQLNPAVLAPGKHEASLRGWFDIAYFPAPDAQNEPASGVRQTYVNGIFGDIFDVIANVPGRTGILKTYQTVIVAGEVFVSDEWGKALREYVESGGTLVVCAEELSGDGVKRLGLPSLTAQGKEAASIRLDTVELPSNRFQFRPIPSTAGAVIALADGSCVASSVKHGKGHIVYVSVPLGLGIDERPIPLLSYLMGQLAPAAMPVRVIGDVEWTVNRLQDGRWLVALINNSGVDKPQHGILPTDHREARAAVVATSFPVSSSEEWMAGTAVAWSPATGGGANGLITIPAGGIRLVAIAPK